MENVLKFRFRFSGDLAKKCYSRRSKSWSVLHCRLIRAQLSQINYKAPKYLRICQYHDGVTSSNGGAHFVESLLCY